MEMTFRLFYSLSVVTAMVSTFLRQLRKSLQIKKIITNAPCVLEFAVHPKQLSITVKRVGYRDTSTISKELQRLHRKSSNNWSVMIFIHSASEIRIYRTSSGNKLDGVS